MKSVLEQTKYVVLLYLLGHIQGEFLGYWSIKLSPYWQPNLGQITSEVKFLSIFSGNLILGVVIGLLVEFLSVLFLLALFCCDRKLYVPITWLLMGVSSGVLVNLLVMRENLLAIGFISPYIVVLLMPYLLVRFVGTDAMAFLMVNTLQLLVLCGFSLLISYCIKFVL